MPKRSVPEKAAAQLFGSNLRELREGRDYTAKNVAELLGLNTDTILKYERGEREPCILTMIQLSHLFGVSLHKLITGEDARPSPGAYAPLKKIQDVVIVRNMEEKLIYVGPNRRQNVKGKPKGRERRSRPN